MSAVANHFLRAMNRSSDHATDDRAIVLTHASRDADLTAEILARAGVPVAVCPDVASTRNCIADGVALVVLAEEALSFDAIEVLKADLSTQPPWSDLPFVVLTSGGHATGLSMRRFQALEGLGHITLLERPVRTVTLLTAVRAALRARRRQYELRDHLAERQRAEEALAMQADLLARSNADLQQFAYITSHDLREPLRTISSFSQMLQRRYRGQLDREADEYIDFITEGVRRMDEMIHDLLIYSRVANQEDRVSHTVDLKQVVNWSLQNLKRSIDESSAEIIVENMPQLPGDEVELVQVFQNLISNAIKYRRVDESPRIKVSAERRDGHWLVSVADNGTGFEPEYRDRVFELFKRLHGRDVPGTGIGLTICKKIVERHSGRIWADSVPGRGATFCFTLPAS